jgi:hypothetical protein
MRPAGRAPRGQGDVVGLGRGAVVRGPVLGGDSVAASTACSSVSEFTASVLV